MMTATSHKDNVVLPTLWKTTNSRAVTISILWENIHPLSFFLSSIFSSFSFLSLYFPSFLCSFLPFFPSLMHSEPNARIRLLRYVHTYQHTCIPKKRSKWRKKNRQKSSYRKKKKTGCCEIQYCLGILVFSLLAYRWLLRSFSPSHSAFCRVNKI